MPPPKPVRTLVCADGAWHPAQPTPTPTPNPNPNPNPNQTERGTLHGVLQEALTTARVPYCVVGGKTFFSNPSPNSNPNPNPDQGALHAIAGKP